MFTTASLTPKKATPQSFSSTTVNEVNRQQAAFTDHSPQFAQQQAIQQMANAHAAQQPNPMPQTTTEVVQQQPDNSQAPIQRMVGPFLKPKDKVWVNTYHTPGQIVMHMTSLKKYLVTTNNRNGPLHAL